MIRTGIVLSGGGARGIAHLGVLQALEELEIKPGIISGVSSGAIIAALYAAGYSPKKILEMVKQHTSFSSAWTVFSSEGLFSPAGIRRILTNAIQKDSFSALKIPLYITATDIKSGMPVAFSTGKLFDAVAGSAAIPGLFSPVKRGTAILVDGGVMNNMPAECIREKCVHLIGSHVNKQLGSLSARANRLQVLDRCFHLAIASTVAINARLCDTLFEPALKRFHLFDVEHADQMFNIGYRTVMDKKDFLIARHETR
ncbi:MAG: patatin-like phospholipase family protein [Mucilaginibacter sp.]